METAPQSGVIITRGPQSWQIIQRNERNTADMEIEGTWFMEEETEFSVQARIVSEITQAPVTRELDWRDADMTDVSAKRFLIRLRDVPQGGLYRIETRIRFPQTAYRWPLRGDCIHHIGVGDVYVIAGQSNASGTGKGTVHDGPMLGVHLFGNDERWRLATHPLEDATSTRHPITITGIFHGHSPWLAFGKRIRVETGIPVGLIPAALGGSPIRQWIREDGEPGPLFENMADMIQQSGGSVAGVLWYQGESDATPEGIAIYEERFGGLVSRIRELLRNGRLPVFTAQLNRHLDLHPDYIDSWSRMRELQRSLSLKLQDVHVVVTIDLPLSDVVHNSAMSNVAIGERFAEAALGARYGHATEPRFPEPSAVRFKDEAILVEFRNLSGDWVHISVIRDFTVIDEEGGVPIRRVHFETNNRIRIELARQPSSQTVLHGLYGSDPAITLKDDGGRCMIPFSIPVEGFRK